MYIKSGNNKIIVKLNNLFIKGNSENGFTIGCYLNNKNFCDLARYSTEQDAIDELNRVERVLMNASNPEDFVFRLIE